MPPSPLLIDLNRPCHGIGIGQRFTREDASTSDFSAVDATYEHTTGDVHQRHQHPHRQLLQQPLQLFPSAEHQQRFSTRKQLSCQRRVHFNDKRTVTYFIPSRHSLTAHEKAAGWYTPAELRKLRHCSRIGKIIRRQQEEEFKERRRQYHEYHAKAATSSDRVKAAMPSQRNLNVHPSATAGSNRGSNNHKVKTSKGNHKDQRRHPWRKDLSSTVSHTINTDDDDAGICYRGLECTVDVTERRRRAMTRLAAESAVFVEQQRQQRSNTQWIPELIADVYSVATNQAKMDAFQRGLQDAASVPNDDSDEKGDDNVARHSRIHIVPPRWMRQRPLFLDPTEHGFAC